MIIVRRAWRDIPDGALVVAPDGRIWEVFSRGFFPDTGPYVDLRDPLDHLDTVHPGVRPDETVDTIVTDLPLEHAVRILAGTFALERI